MAKFNEFQHVFSPIKVGNLTLKTAFTSPMVCCLSNAAGEVTTEFVEFWACRPTEPPGDYWRHSGGQ